jgi:hypothetical protein
VKFNQTNQVQFELCLSNVAVNGVSVSEEVTCTELSYLSLSGPFTTTIGQATEFHAMAEPYLLATEPVTWSWSASDEGFVNFSINEGKDSWNDVTWWTTGTKTITTTATNACSTVTATLPITVTGIAYNPPFDPDYPEPPPLLPDCDDCGKPDWGILHVGRWIDWL